MKVQSYKDLIVWQKSIELVKEIYTMTKELPTEEQFGLTSQMRRASISIPSNIAEGYKRRRLGEYIRFLCISDASAAELETQIIISKSLYPNINFFKIDNLLLEIQKMLAAVIKKMEIKLKTNR